MPVKSALRYVYSQRFKTAFYVFFAAMLCYSFVFGQQAPSQDAPSIEISDISAPYDGKVSASAAVRGKNGNPIGGLKKDSFTLHIDDKKIPDFSFKQTSDDPLSLIIALDVSGSMKGVPIVEAKKIIAQFMGYLKESDYAALVTFGAGVNKAIGFTKDRDIIYNKVDELLADEPRTVLFKAVAECIKLSSSSPTPKSAILLITDSKDEHSSVEEADVIAAVRQAHIPIYTIALGKYEYIGFLKKISEISGGQFFLFPKYADVARLAKAATSGLKTMYLFEFPFSAPNGKYTAAIKFNYNGADITAKKEFTNNVPKDSKPPVGSSPGYPISYPINYPKQGGEFPVNHVLIYLLIGLSAISVVLLVLLALKGNKPPPRNEHQSEEIKKLHDDIAATTDMLTRMDSEIKTASEKNIESSAALSSGIKAVGEQISTVSRQIDDAATAMKNGVIDLQRNLKDASQKKFEQEFTGLRVEISAIEDVLSAIMAKQLEHSELHSLESANNLNAISETIYKDNIAAIEKVQSRLNEIDVAITKLDTEIKKYAAAESESGTALTNKIRAVEEKTSDITRHMDTSLDAMKYSIVDLVNTIMDIEKTHGLTPGQTFEKIEGRIIEIETSITMLAARIRKEPAAPIDETKTIEQIISNISRQMEDAVYAVKDSITGMENGIIETSAATYGKEISGMRRDVVSVRDALGEVMRFLLILSE
ncbi:MAG: VWA domain-containing protein [Nitrospirae bacterium]|nr:VWA domain-containing protein [Nitrospirota bacterium]